LPGGTPNVKIVNVCYDGTSKGVIYFSTIGDNQKVEEFEKNPSVAFTTVPHEGHAHVWVKKGTVQKSKHTIYALKDECIRKIPD
jgi:general stress protein 26